MTFNAAAGVYDRHVGRYGDQLAAALVRAVGIEHGMRVLDVGCGPGALARALAAKVGADFVSAVDPSDTFVAACRERISGADVRQAQAEELPFADETFAAVLSQLVVNFLADADRGLDEMRRVCTPGGVVAGCVWDYSGRMTMLRAFWDAAVELDPDAPDEGRTMRFCTTEELGELWRRHFDEARVGEIVVQARYDDFDDYWFPFPEGVAPSGAYCASLDDPGRAMLREACRRRLGNPDGPFTLPARAWLAIGRA